MENNMTIEEKAKKYDELLSNGAMVVDNGWLDRHDATRDAFKVEMGKKFLEDAFFDDHIDATSGISCLFPDVVLSEKYFTVAELKKAYSDWMKSSGVWHSPEEKPANGANILCYHWYDGPHYFPAVYNAKFDEAEFELPSDDSCPLDAVDKWMYIPDIEPEKLEKA